MKRLHGKVAFVTGAGTGMGRACALMFAREGALVIGAGRRSGPVDETRTLAERAGCSIEGVRMDVSDEGEVKSVIERVAESYGRIDILINNAGMGGAMYRALREGGMEAIAETPTEHWHELIHNNLDSAFYMCKAVLPIMTAQGGGAIVNISSTAAVRGISGAHAYAVTKAGIQIMTRSMAVRYGRDNIRVNCVCPGTTDTPMMAGSPSMDPLRHDNPARFDYNPLGRAGTPEEIAYGCLFLASEEASYINGVVLPIDGGVLSSPA